MLDYKFLLIIIISMIVYFLYRRIEKIELTLKNIENTNTNQPIELSLPEENNKDIQLPLPLPEQSIDNKLLEKNDNFDTINFPFNSQNVVSPSEQNVVSPSEQNNVIDVDINLNKYIEVENMINTVKNTIVEDNTLEEYSNEQQSDVPIYSNDNEEDHHSSLMESMVDAVNPENDNQVELDTLLKNNKLPELQQMAETLHIDIHKENSKKKTKLELAIDILNSKK
jgi:hypothetical protein